MRVFMYLKVVSNFPKLFALVLFSLIAIDVKAKQICKFEIDLINGMNDVASLRDEYSEKLMKSKEKSENRSLQFSTVDEYYEAYKEIVSSIKSTHEVLAKQQQKFSVENSNENNREIISMLKTKTDDLQLNLKKLEHNLPDLEKKSNEAAGSYNSVHCSDDDAFDHYDEKILAAKSAADFEIAKMKAKSLKRQIEILSSMLNPEESDFKFSKDKAIFMNPEFEKRPILAIGSQKLKQLGESEDKVKAEILKSANLYCQSQGFKSAENEVIAVPSSDSKFAKISLPLNVKADSVPQAFEVDDGGAVVTNSGQKFVGSRPVYVGSATRPGRFFGLRESQTEEFYGTQAIVENSEFVTNRYKPLVFHKVICKDRIEK